MNVKGTREGKDLQKKNKIIKKMPICVCVCVCVYNYFKCKWIKQSY